MIFDIEYSKKTRSTVVPNKLLLYPTELATSYVNGKMSVKLTSSKKVSSFGTDKGKGPSKLRGREYYLLYDVNKYIAVLLVNSFLILSDRICFAHHDFISSIASETKIDLD